MIDVLPVSRKKQDYPLDAVMGYFDQWNQTATEPRFAKNFAEQFGSYQQHLESAIKKHSKQLSLANQMIAISDDGEMDTIATTIKNNIARQITDWQTTLAQLEQLKQEFFATFNQLAIDFGIKQKYDNKPLPKEKPMNEIPTKPREQKRLSDGRPYVNIVLEDGTLQRVTPRLNPITDKTNSIPIKPITTPGNMICEFVNKDEKLMGKFVRVAIEDFYMNKEDHETVRFFDVYKGYDRLNAIKQTDKLIDALQIKRSVATLERELKEKYDIKKPEEVVDVLDNVTVDLGEHVGPTSNNIDLLDSRFVVGESIEEGSQLENIDPIKMNVVYDNINVMPWAVDGPAKNKLLLLKEQTTFQGIKRIILELDDLLSTDLVADINRLATKWMNNHLHRNYGQPTEMIDSFVGDLDELEGIVSLHFTDVISEQDWKDAAKKMLQTALNLVEVDDAIHEQLDQHHEKGHVTILNRTRVIRVNKTGDEISIPGNEVATGVISTNSSPTLLWALQSITEDLKEDTLETVLITADGQKMFIHQFSDDEYVISKH